jgi:hypothetical protein
MNLYPKLIKIQEKGLAEDGLIYVLDDADNVPFSIRRVFYIIDTRVDKARGGHAHHNTEMIMIALKGEIKVRTISMNGVLGIYSLSDPNVGLYLPKMCWHDMDYSDGAVQLVLCNTLYEEGDYIRDKKIFESYITNK